MKAGRGERGEVRDGAIRVLVFLLGLGGAPTHAAAQSAALPLKHPPARTTATISAGDLMSRLYILADDSMMGRLPGHVGETRATAYLESQVRGMGLVPAGEAGTFFQTVPLVKREVDPQATLTVNGTVLRVWEDVIPRDQGSGARPVNGVRTVFGGVWGVGGDTANLIDPERAAGKLVVLAVPPGGGVDGGGEPPQLPNRGAVLARFRTAAAIAVAGMHLVTPDLLGNFRRPSLSLPRPASADTATVPAYLYVTAAAARALLGAAPDSLAPGAPGAPGRTVGGELSFRESPAAGRNVVAILRGSDPEVAGQYVAVGAHLDHVGFNRSPVDHDSLHLFRTQLVALAPGATDGAAATAAQRGAARVNVDSLRRLRPARPDSIYNGAEDNASGSAAVLEITEALAFRRPAPRRSVLFIWHTAEELGLLGARWFVEHPPPTVPLDSVVAYLNIDGLGRYKPSDFAGGVGGGAARHLVVGSRRLSTELGDLVEAVNAERRLVTFDYSYDAPGHPTRIYCRSDHFQYARFGVPSVFITDDFNPDYHQVTDEAQYIDYATIARATQLLHDIALRVASLDHRLVVDRPKPDPNAPCVQ